MVSKRAVDHKKKIIIKKIKLKPQVKCFWNYVVQIIAFCLWCDELNFLCWVKTQKTDT